MSKITIKKIRAKMFPVRYVNESRKYNCLEASNFFFDMLFLNSYLYLVDGGSKLVNSNNNNKTSLQRKSLIVKTRAYL